MKVKRPAVLFLSSSIIGIIIAIESVSIIFKLMLLSIAIFIYGKLFIEKKLYYKTLIVIMLFASLGFYRFKTVEFTFDKYVANVESLGKGNKSITGEVVSIGKSTNSNYFILDNCIAEGIDIGKCRCYLKSSLMKDVKIGNTIKISAGTSIIEETSNEGEFNQKDYYRSDGITFISYANEVEIINKKHNVLKQKIYEIKLLVKSQIKKVFNDKDAGLFSAMITGDKSEIDKIQKKRFSDNGIAHILAISGLHLSILGLALFELLRKKLSVNISASIVSAFILLYALFIDAGPSSLRAIIMLFVRFFSLSIGRTYDSKNTLFIVAFVFLMLRPYLLFNAGFQFSYVAIYALNSDLKFARLVSNKNKNENLVIAYQIREIKVPPVIILTLFLFPITIYHYFTYPLYSIFVNIIVIPLMAFILGFGLASLGLSFIYLPVAKIVSYIVHLIFTLYDKLCEMVEYLPKHILTLGKPNIYEMLYYYIVIFLVITIINDNTEKNIREYNSLKSKSELDKDSSDFFASYRKKQFIKVSICIIALIISTFIISVRNHSDMRMTFISIGQGDGAIIESKDTIITVDGGSTSNTSNGQYILAPHIKSRAINHIDYAFISHADADHTNGIKYLLENEDEISIYNLVLPITATDDSKFDSLKKSAEESNVNIIYMKEGDVFEVKDDYVITALSPNEKSLKNNKRNENEMSLTFRLDYKNHSALFTGDIGKETMNRMLKDDFSLENLDVDVLKVPHHGSKNSNVASFYELVSPEYSVVSYGANNNYGHPNEQTALSIENTGSKVIKTAEKGQIDIYFDSENIRYKTYK